MFSPQSNRQYPILLCPDRWHRAIQNPKVNQPRFDKARPQEPIKPSIKVKTSSIILVLINLITVALGFILRKQYDWLLPLSIFLFLIVSLPMIFQEYDDYQKKVKRYTKQEQRYKNELELYESEYQEYQRIAKKNQSLSRSDLLKKVSLDSIRYTYPPKKGINPQKGLTEDVFFSESLKQYFDPYVATDLCLSRGYDTKYPDFVFQIPKLHLYICIEIDEPYTTRVRDSEKREPVHYQGADDERNKFFLDNGWFIIRFSEEQVAKYPDSCCKVIAEAVKEIIQDDSLLEKFKSKYISNLPTQKQWTKSEAIKIERGKYLAGREWHIPKVKKQFLPSKYQSSIFDFVKNGSGNGLVIAVAGSGKSTTLIEAANLINTRNALFLAFNNSIAAELSHKLGNVMKASTIHSLGLSILNSVFGKINNNDQKYRSIISNVCDYFDEEYQLLIEKLINFTRYTLTDSKKPEDLKFLCDHFNLDMTYFDEVFPYLDICLQKGIELARQEGVIDFTDMIWLPIKLNLPTTKYEWLFCDECQDLSACQLELVLRCLAEDGRILFVGDPKQAIYGFSGADCDSVEKIKERVKATELPLSICYRCPSSHIELARKLVPQIEPRQDALQGLIKELNIHEFYKLIQLKEDDNNLIIARRFDPLRTIYRTLKESILVCLRGGEEIAQNLISILPTDAKKFDYTELLQQQTFNKKLLEELDFIWNRYDCTNINELKERISWYYAEANYPTVLSTIHKAKGLEADRVFIIAPNEIPLLREGQKDWEKQQEIHIKYVALTRSRSELYFVNLDSN